MQFDYALNQFSFLKSRFADIALSSGFALLSGHGVRHVPLQPRPAPQQAFAGLEKSERDGNGLQELGTLSATANNTVQQETMKIQLKHGAEEELMNIRNEISHRSFLVRGLRVCIGQKEKYSCG